MPIPYTFSTAAGTIGLNELDENFAYVSNLVPSLAITAGTVTESNQPNIAAVGILNSLSVTGNIIGGSLTASILTGTLSVGSQLNINQLGTLDNLAVAGNITAGNVSASYLQGTYVTAINLGGTLSTASQPGITSLGTLTSLEVSGSANASTINATTITATTSNATTINATIFNGNLSPATQSNITTIGTLASLSVTGNITSGNLFGTNVSGTLSTAAQPNITSVGTLTSLNVTGNVYGGNLTTAGLISAIGGITSTGTITATTFKGSGAQLSNIPGANVSGVVPTALTANTVTNAIQSNITTLGTLLTLTVSGRANFNGQLKIPGTIDPSPAPGAIYWNNSTGVLYVYSSVYGWTAINSSPAPFFP